MTVLDAKWGSSVAKRGFNNEEDIAQKFRNWENDDDAKEWLQIMGYDLNEIESIEVENLNRNIKSDIEVEITAQETTKEGISIKRAKKSANYNQVDKRWVENYKEKWSIPEDAVEALKMFVGREGYQPQELESLEKELQELKDERRLYFDELPSNKSTSLETFLKNNKVKIMRDILKGEEPHQTDWILITEIYEESNKTKWTLRNIDNAVEVLSGDFSTTRRGNIKLGNITLQRKGGDNGRETAQMLQFKMRPFDLVEE